MEPAKLRKHTASSNKTLKENEAAEDDLDETKISDLLSMNVEQPNTGVQFDEVKISFDQAKNDKTEETNSGESKKAVTADYVYDYAIMTEINGDNLAEEDQYTSEGDEINYGEDVMWGHDEKSEEDNEKNVVDKDEVNVEVETEEDDEEWGEDDVESGEDDVESGEDDVESGEDDVESGEDDVESGEDDVESGEDVEELGEDDEELAEDNEESEEDDDDKKNEEEEKELADGDGGKSEEPTMEKVEASLKEEVDKSRGRSRKKVQPRSSKKLESGNEEKPKSSRKRKAKKRVETMGMIFMCSSTTKNDCYRYRVLGLPASKKNMVEKIYTGMRLFLYDVDLKLLNGIYKAAGPGGYNIEPKAFKSQFPSQVRFTVLDDCLPIAEEKFKKVIKDNYFTKTKFDCLLTSEQVKKLCKLFVSASKGQRRMKLNRSCKAENHITEHRERPRKQRAGEETRNAVREGLSYRKRLRKRQRKLIVPGPPVRQPLRLPVPAPHPYRDGRDPPTERRVYYRDELVPPTERRDSYRDERGHRDSYRYGQEPPTERHDYYEDERHPPIVHRDSYRDRRDLPALRRDSYRDGRDPPTVTRDSYRDGRDPPIERRGSYRDGQDPLVERQSPYRDGRDYRDRRVIYIERHDPYNDVRDSYLQHSGPYRDGLQFEPSDYYRRDPISDRRDAYREDRLAEIPDPYQHKVLLEHHDVRPAHLETRWVHDIGSRDSYRVRSLYAEPKYSLEYPSRVGLERDHRPISVLSAQRSTTGQLPEYYPRRA